jgi:peptide-methionine (S)-S-oxide reductase
MFFTDRRKTEMVSPKDALPGRPEPLPTAETHFLTGTPLKSPVPDGMEEAMFGMGCFWGVERKFWQTTGVADSGGLCGRVHAEPDLQGDLHPDDRP